MVYATVSGMLGREILYCIGAYTFNIVMVCFRENRRVGTLVGRAKS